MIAEDSLYFLQGEIAQLHDLGLGPRRGRQNRTSLFLAVNFRIDPGFVLAPQSAPIREMGAGLEADFHHPSAGYPLGLMRNLNQKSRHGTKLPLAGVFLRSGPPCPEPLVHVALV